ncbi:hypothetical protein [Aestuariibacter salexigens]|uniref:hypothetical protein n=1 Tax=Aestuariibacter salexigens TaxID=226010 RepID=UPI0004101997|nr:hypothetical protein [Aestuariibacter salexigens]
MEIESSLVASQNALVTNPVNRQPEREAEARQQQQQRETTELPRTQVVSRQASAEAFEQAERFRQRQQTSYDQPGRQGQQAVNAYQSLAIEQQREQVRTMLGVDVYA